MSMCAEFVQIAPERLRDMIANPQLVTELFENPPIAPDAQADVSKRLEALGAASNPIRLEALKRAPQAIAAALAAMDPATRAMLSKRLETLGLNLEEIQRGRGNEAILKLMTARGLTSPPQTALSQPPQAPGGNAAPAAVLSLEKAWHGLHYLFCGAAEPGLTILSQAILGGTEIGDDDFGYGPARYFTIEQTAQIAREMDQANLESEMKSRFDPVRMTSLGIYPGGWETQGAEWLFVEFRRLRDFYVDAARRGFAAVTGIV